jgi:two-component system response regulator NreC
VRTKILLADDHKIILDGLRSLIEKEQDLEVVAEASDGLSAIRMAHEHKPHIAVIDVTMPGLNGIEVTRRLTSELKNVKVIALSMHSDKRFVQGMLRAGASGYLLKDSAFGELVQAIKDLLRGRVYLSPALSDYVIKDYIKQLSRDNDSSYGKLTKKEREVLQLIVEGKTSKEIALLLFISIKTVDTHRHNIMQKLNIRTISGLTKFAIREGLTTLNP